MNQTVGCLKSELARAGQDVIRYAATGKAQARALKDALELDPTTPSHLSYSYFNSFYHFLCAWTDGSPHLRLFRHFAIEPVQLLRACSSQSQSILRGSTLCVPKVFYVLYNLVDASHTVRPIAGSAHGARSCTSARAWCTRGGGVQAWGGRGALCEGRQDSWMMSISDRYHTVRLRLSDCLCSHLITGRVH